MENLSKNQRLWEKGLWIPLGLWTVLMIQGAMLPPGKIPGFLFKINDKIIHALEFLILFFLAQAAFSKGGIFWLKRRSLGNAFIYCFLMGFLTEFLQMWVPGRTAEFKDLLADFVGYGTGFLWVQVFDRANRNSYGIL